MQMTYRKAIIILDRLVTTKRIEVDREELREAVKAAQKALNIVAYLPPNHGRLIDADRLKSMMEHNHCNSCDNYSGARCSACWVDDCFSYIDDIPEIIEAEVSE